MGVPHFCSVFFACLYQRYLSEKIEHPSAVFFGIEEQDDSKKRQAAAGQKVYSRFVKSKGSLNKYQHLMIRDMAYFEALYNEMLSDEKTKVEMIL